MSFNHTHIFGTKNGIFKVTNPDQAQSNYVNITNSEFTCVEDEISMDIFNTVFTGILIKIFTIIGTYYFLVVLKGKILKKPEKSWKTPF
jgi:hypothetical protein